MVSAILFVPGFWEGPSVFDNVSSLLAADGFKTVTAELRSTGTISPGNPTKKDDIAAIREQLSRLVVNQGDEVVLVLHSAGGFLGSEAMQGLVAKHRQERGEKGGVKGIVFVTAGILPEGTPQPPLPFVVVDGGAAYCINAETSLFNDLPESERKKWMAAIKPQPSEGWDSIVEYGGWKDVPSVYLVCESDLVLPTSIQEQFASVANSKIVRCSAGHVPFLSQPDTVVEVIKTAIADFSK